MEGREGNSGRVRTLRPRSAAGGEAPRPGRGAREGATESPRGVRHDLFRERLRALESVVEQALRESGGSTDGDGRLARLAEGVLDGYARLARTLEEGSFAEALSLLRARPRVPVIDDFGYDRDYEQLVAPLFRALYSTWWRVEVFGLENVPAEGPVMLVGNHSGGLFAWDGAMVKVAVQTEHPAHRPVRPLVDDFVYHLPFLGDFMTRVGGVRACPENAERLLQRGEIVLVFPEGTKGMGKLYRRRYRLARFGRGGFVRIALRAGAPIVPVAIVGAEEIHPILGRWDWLARQIGLPYFPLTPTFPWLGLLGLLPLPSRWRIEFGRPIEWRGKFGPEAADDRLLVSRLTEGVRQQVQRLLGGALERRGAPFSL